VRYALWIVQVLLALLFLFAGAAKFLMPADEMAAQMPTWLPIWFVYFIGVCEVLGALGLVLPGLFRVRPELTPLAAAGLTIIMAGAVVTTLAMGMGALALLPLVVGLFTGFVAYGRWKLAPHGGASQPTSWQPAR
jgi:uncharacterized membrane protein